MINTISNTLEAQEKTQQIKQSPSTKIGTKPYARSRRNELIEATGRTGEQARQTGVSSSDRTLDRTLAAKRPDSGKQRPIEYGEVPELRNCDRTCPVAGDRTLAVSDQCFAVQRSGRPDASGQDNFSVRSVAEKRDFVPKGYFLSRAYNYTPQSTIW